MKNKKSLAVYAVFLTVVIGVAVAQVPIVGSIINAVTGYTVNGAAPSGQVICGNGTVGVFASSCAISVSSATSATTATNSTQVGGVGLAGLCQSSGTGCPASGITGVNAGSGYIKFPSGLMYEWMPGPSVTESGDSLHSGTWAYAFPNAIFGAGCATTTGQGGTGSPGDTDIHAMQISTVSTTSWTVRHSVGGVYSQAQTLSCFLWAVGD